MWGEVGRYVKVCANRVRCSLDRSYVHFFGTHQRNGDSLSLWERWLAERDGEGGLCEQMFRLCRNVEFALTAQRRHHASMNGKHLSSLFQIEFMFISLSRDKETEPKKTRLGALPLSTPWVCALFVRGGLKLIVRLLRYSRKVRTISQVCRFWACPKTAVLSRRDKLDGFDEVETS